MVLKINPNDQTFWLEWGGDLMVSQNGGLIMASGWDQIRQRILRRLLTNPKFTLHDGTPIAADYVFDQDYGIGLRRLIGQPYSADLDQRLRSGIRDAVTADQGVAVGKDPEITIKQFNNHIVAIEIVVTLKSGRLGRISIAPS